MAQNIYDNDEFFAGYARLPRSVAGLDGAPEWPALRALLPDLRGCRVLDLGCGYGWFCRWAREAGAAAVLGIDVSEKMLARARADTTRCGDQLSAGGSGKRRAAGGGLRFGLQLAGAPLHRRPRPADVASVRVAGPRREPGLFDRAPDLQRARRAEMDARRRRAKDLAGRPITSTRGRARPTGWPRASSGITGRSRPPSTCCCGPGLRSRTSRSGARAKSRSGRSRAWADERHRPPFLIVAAGKP